MMFTFMEIPSAPSKKNLDNKVFFWMNFVDGEVHGKEQWVYLSFKMKPDMKNLCGFFFRQITKILKNL